MKLQSYFLGAIVGLGALVAACSGSSSLSNPHYTPALAMAHRNPRTTYSGGSPCYVPTADPYYLSGIDYPSFTPDPNSSAMIQSVHDHGGGGDFTAVHGDEFVNISTVNTPKLSVGQYTGNSENHPISWQIPWDHTFNIETPGPPGNDAHAMVVNNTSCHEFELYNTVYSPPPNAAIWAGSGATWDLTQNFVPLTGNVPSALSSGTSLYLGLAQYRDQAHAFFHTLNIALEAGSMCQYKYTAPADDTAQAANSDTTNCLPWGAHLILRATDPLDALAPVPPGTFDSSQCKDQYNDPYEGEGYFIVQELLTYGAIAADDSTSGDEFYLDDGPWDTTNPVGVTDGELHCLDKIPLADFYVLKLGTVHTLSLDLAKRTRAIVKKPRR